jgi:protease-4
MRRVRLALLVLVLLGIVLLLARGQAPLELADGSALVIDVRGQYVEAPQPALLMRLLGRQETPLVALLSELSKAERDPRIATVVARVGPLQIGWGKAQEIRAALAELREAGKRVVALLEVERYGANLEYYVASAADEVHVAPATRSPFAGLAAEYLFLGGFFEKLGVEIEVEKIGRYKSATETFASTRMSDANREMSNALLDSIEGGFVAGIAEGRGLTRADVLRAIDAAPATPEEILRFGLADGIGYLDDVIESLGKPPTVSAEDYARVDAANLGFAPEASFALVYGTGPVVSGEGSISRSGDRVLASRTVSEALVSAAEDPAIDAILFRVDSPGGSALASDLVWHATQKAKQSGKPLVVSFSDVAASGGYYVAAGADAIVANPGTLTGSIGVFVLRPVLRGLFDKLGIGVEALTRGRHADLFLSSRTLSPGSRARLRADVEGVYDLFVARVSEGRALPPEVVDAAGRGRVWTGEQALERGLVDSLGGLRVAARRAREALGLDPEADVTLVPYPPAKSLSEQLRDTLSGALAPGGLASLPLPSSLEELTHLVTSTSPGAPALLPPFLVEIR